MDKIGIINCYEIHKKCYGTGCINSFNEKSGSFDRYAFKDAEIVDIIHCQDCNEKSMDRVYEEAAKLKERGVNIIHLSSCIKSDCNWYDEYIHTLSKDFEVVDFTHGS